MPSFNQTFIASLFALLISATANTASAQYDHIDELGIEIVAKTNLLVGETSHYRHTPAYTSLVRGAVNVRSSANRICILARTRCDLARLQAELDRLDECFYHLESVFDSAELDASYGHGHIQGPTAQVKELLCAIEDCIRLMVDDVASLRRSPHRVNRVYRNETQVYRAPVYRERVVETYREPRYNSRQVYQSRSRNYGHGHRDYGPSITIGNDKVKFRIKF